MHQEEDLHMEQETELDHLQTELEGRIKKDLDQLTIIINNKYAGGKHVFDYQLKLIQLTPE